MSAESSLSKTTVVLGGGGVWGVAWMAGVIKGLAEQGLDLGQAEAFIGTSAGSIMGTFLAAGLPIDQIYERQLQPEATASQMTPPTDEAFAVLIGVMQREWPNTGEKGRELGRLALQSETMDPQARRDALAARLDLPSADWPAKSLSITAVDAETGELVVFNRSSGIDLIDAVAASCAVPVIWPPAVIKGRPYIDGGVLRTPDNAHLALGARSVLVLSPVGGQGAGLAPFEQDLADLRKAGAKVAVIRPDTGALASMAPHPLHPATRKPGALAGRTQGLGEAPTVNAIL